MKQLIHRPPVNFDDDPRPRRQAAKNLDPARVEASIRRAEEAAAGSPPKALATGKRPVVITPARTAAKATRPATKSTPKPLPVPAKAAPKAQPAPAPRAARTTRQVKLPASSRGAFLLRLPPVLDQRLRTFAERSGLSVNSVVCAAVAFYINGKA